MLTQLTVSQFAIAEKVELQFDRGMTALTGETGAGKSIVLDALSLTLGGRADSGMVRQGADKAEITAVFDVSRIPQAREWLHEHDLDDEDECLLRRVVRRDGRSRGYINGQPCPLQDMKQLGGMLMDIHSQHEHQSLLKKDTHSRLVEEFGQFSEQAAAVRSAYRHWHGLQKKLDALRDDADERHARTELLRYQVEELDRLGLAPEELPELETEQKQLTSSEEVLRQCHAANELCSEGEPAAASLLQQALQQLGQIPVALPQLEDTLKMLEEARIQVEEAGDNLRHLVADYPCDPQRLAEVEERLSTVYQLARKHRVAPEQLCEHHQQLALELAELDGGENSLEQLSTDAEAALAQYHKQAAVLSKARSKAGAELDKRVALELGRLSMPGIRFITRLSPNRDNQPSPDGQEELEFLVSTNAGQPPRPLAKVASGGELSRISLAIQVVVAQTSTIPTLLFDEVDVGIGGGVAEVVGRLLRTLGESGQVLCVTHLAQVATQAHQHLFVSKFTQASDTFSRVDKLASSERIQEVARMIGGVDLTEQTLAHAREMFERGQATQH
ncbi:MAG: DNA repair protein RecN [Oleiphilaceae bacterium]|nr:DNA repair protein RecN [Oleiphilaceae bacterium]